MKPLASKLGIVKESGTVKFTPLLKQLREQGREIFDFAVGEPDHGAPPEVVAATQKALLEGQTRYVPVAGLQKLREKIADYYKTDLPWAKPEHVMVSGGSKQNLYTLFQTLCDAGDEVLVPVPYWTSYPEQIAMAGAKAILVPTADLALDPAAVRQAISPRSKAIIINCPSNPTGVIFERQALAETLRLAAAHDLWVISDEAYDSYVYDGNSDTPLAAQFPEYAERIVTVKSFSKIFAMTGFRIGYTIADVQLTKQMTMLQGHISGSPTTFAQWGAIAALDIPKQRWTEQGQRFQKRRDFAYGLISEVLPCRRPDGAFYLFPDVRGFLRANGAGRFENSEALAWHLLETAGIATVPGSAFGQDGYIRISFAQSDTVLEQGLHKLVTAIKQL